MSTLAAWAYVVSLLGFTCDAADRSASKTVFKTPAPPVRCVPQRTKVSYTVCVVDEARRPVPNATVVATRSIMMEGFGDVGFENQQLGTVLTDAMGRAVFAVPPLPLHWLASFRDFGRRATAMAGIWPPESTTEADDTIVVGPARTITLRTRDRTCGGTTEISVDFAWGEPLRDGAVTATLGPGSHTATKRWCYEGSDVSTQIEFLGRNLPRNGVLDLD